jgi:hypothetical protein
MPSDERQARGELAKIAHERPFLQASLVTMERTCGKANCRCTRGDKHVALYLATRVQGRRKMIYVPKPLEGLVRSWVQSYQDMGRLSQRISTKCLEAFLDQKRRLSGASSRKSSDAAPSTHKAVAVKKANKRTAHRKGSG